MSGDTFMEPKQGKSTGAKILIFCLILFGGMLVLCCGGGFYIQQSSQAENSEVAAVARTEEIAEIEIPDYFQGETGMNLNFIFMKTKMAVYQLKEGIPIEVADLDEDKIGKEAVKKKKVGKEKKKAVTKKKKGVPKLKKEKTDKKKKTVADKKKPKTKAAAKTKKALSKKSDGALVLIWFNMWGMNGGTDQERKEMLKQMRMQMSQNSNIDTAMDIDSTKRISVKIVGTLMDVKIRKGRHSRSHKRIRSVEIVFPGRDNGMVFLLMIIPESLYNQAKLVEMLENIKL